MSYAYEDLDDSQFEHLVVHSSRKLFGLGVQSFAAGRDGGRDARFEGTAERFPSTADPWFGITVIQAKHTNALNAHFADSDFNSTADSSVLSKEIPRIRNLVDTGEVDNYLLFSNRRLGGVVAPTIKERVATETGLEPAKIYLAGVEYLDDLLRIYPGLIDLAGIDPIDGPLLPSSYDLAEVILAIADQLEADIDVTDAPIVDRVSYTEKNRINGMTPAFAKVLTGRYMIYSRRIETFLADPANQSVLRRYEGSVEEFQLKIVAKRASYQSFDDVFNYLVDVLVQRDGVLARHRRLLRTMIFYMYWHCDIGESEDA